MRVSDLQVLMLRSQDVGKIQQVQQGNESDQQQNFAQGLLKQSEIARQTVQTTSDTRQGKVDGEGARREREEAPREESGQQQPEQNETEELADPFVGKFIDCKI
jgi:hypothetical protein